MYIVLADGYKVALSVKRDIRETVDGKVPYESCEAYGISGGTKVPLNGKNAVYSGAYGTNTVN